MKVVDFGKNTFQCEIALRFDCLSPDFFVIVARSFASKINERWYVGKEPQIGLTLTTGIGTSESPFYQIKFNADRVLLWAGWNVSYDAWQQWRLRAIDDLTMLSNNFPSAFVLQLTTQAGIVVPFEKLKTSLDDNPHLKPVADFYRGFIPDEYLKWSAGHTIFAAEGGGRTIETQVVGNQTTQENTYNFLHRWIALDPNRTISQNLIEHLSSFDNLLSKYHSAIIEPLLLPS